MTRLNLSLHNLIKQYNQHKNVIGNYLNCKRNGDVIENFSINYNIMGLGIGAFLSLFVLVFVLYVWAIWSLITYKNQLQIWAIVLGVLSLFLPTGPIGTLLIVYLTKSGFVTTLPKTSFTYRF